MSDKFKKINKEYCITDNSVNVYGYRCLTEGLLLDEVKKNPIGYLMHDRNKGVVVRWEDFRVEDDRVFAKPVVNLSHPEGQSIADQIENGFLNAASVGKIVVLEASDAKDLMLKNQTRPTVTKWFPREISLVDIPGNYNALANLFDKENNELNLSDLQNFTIKNMSKNNLDAAKIYAALNLKDGDDTGIVLDAIQNLVDKADRTDKAEADLEAKTQELNDLKNERKIQKVEDLIAKGKSEKKLTNEMAETLKQKYSDDPDGLEDLIDQMPAQVTIIGNLGAGDVPEKYQGRTWDDLYKSNELPEVKDKFPDLYAKLHEEKFNPKED
ncbi:hypothetical protein JSO56_04955 [Riemerella anatipestifer]|uniref:phage protease n=1 Tax=Riemerella anatipestifer TaxID=34085 RepID=UPI0030C4456E